MILLQDRLNKLCNLLSAVGLAIPAEQAGACPFSLKSVGSNNLINKIAVDVLRKRQHRALRPIALDTE